MQGVRGELAPDASWGFTKANDEGPNPFGCETETPRMEFEFPEKELGWRERGVVRSKESSFRIPDGALSVRGELFDASTGDQPNGILRFGRAFWALVQCNS